MLVDALVSVGCHDEPRIRSDPPDDDYRFDQMPDLLVFHRSLPHAHHWPDLLYLRKQMEKAKYSVHGLLAIRDWNCTIQSVLRRDPERDPEIVEQNMLIAIWRSIINMPDLIVVSYESFCHHHGFRRWLFCDKLGLSEPDIEIKYGNEKYYEALQD